MPAPRPARAARRLIRLPQLHPAQAVVSAFAGVVLLGTLLLMLPAARRGPGGTGFGEALFHATSAVCVTGLSAVDTATHWTPFGQAVLIGLVQVGGFGIMTFASVLGLVVARRLGIRGRLQAAAEGGLVDQTDIRRVLLGVVRISLSIEAAIAIALTLRWWLGYDEGFGHALWLGVFHAIAAFNNAGFALFSDNLVGFVADPFVCLPVAAGIILGGLGFPVLMELRRELGSRTRETRASHRRSRSRPADTPAVRGGRGHRSLNLKIVLVASVVLVAVGAVAVTALEWDNPRTLGSLDPPARLLAGFFQGVSPRTAGFNSVDIGAMRPQTWFVMDILMFIGAGPGGTGGGIKVTTAAVLLFLVVAEVRGDGAVNLFGRRLPRSTQRAAISVATVAVSVVVLATLAIMVIEPIGLDRSLFEVLSAFTTTGMTTGVTSELSPGSKGLLVVLMFAGRLGPITLASAVALRGRSRLYSVPVERPIIG